MNWSMDQPIGVRPGAFVLDFEPKVFLSHEVSADYAGARGEDSVVSSEVRREVVTALSGKLSEPALDHCQMSQPVAARRRR